MRTTKTVVAKSAPKTSAVQITGMSKDDLLLSPGTQVEDTLVLKKIDVGKSRAEFVFESGSHGIVKGHLKPMDGPIRMEVKVAILRLGIDLDNPQPFKAVIEVSRHLRWYLPMQDWGRDEVSDTVEDTSTIADF